MRIALSFLLSVLAFGSASGTEQTSTSPSSGTGVQIEIQSPSADFTASTDETIVEVEGIASAIGGVRYLDMIFVMDTSQSLRGTDPKNNR